LSISQLIIFRILSKAGHGLLHVVRIITPHIYVLRAGDAAYNKT